MNRLKELLDALDERNLAVNVGSAHDEARLSFNLASNTVPSFEAFTELIGNYYSHHFSECFDGARLPSYEVQERAKEIVNKDYRRHGGDIQMAFQDAKDGVNGGVRVILDGIAEALKQESLGRYVESLFDRIVSPASWDDQVEIIRQFIAHCGLFLGDSIDRATPERYARNYKELIQAYVEGTRRSSRVFRRL